VSSAAVVIALDGGAGTLSEIAMAWQLGRPVIALTATGWAGELAGRCLDARSDRAVIAAANVAQAIAHCRSLLDSGIGEAADIGTGWRTRTAGTTEREVTP
jgi:predicted Rossmann-fold nucleotide-binding protein